MNRKAVALQAFVLTFLIVLSGCTSSIPTKEQRLATAFSISTSNTSNQFTKTQFETDTFPLFSFLSMNSHCSNKDIKIFIEGDGFAWKSSSVISDDPTPINPVGLKLMSVEPSQCKVYLARPCQYVKNQSCHYKYWTSHRFSEKVLQAYQSTLNQIKNKYQNQSFTLIGFSGGAAVSALVAKDREDISQFISVAGNLDIDKWVKHHGITPLKGSLNPADFCKDLQDLNQIHLIGGKDRIVPDVVFKSYLQGFKNDSKIKSYIYENNSHTKGWEQTYKNFVLQPTKTD